jgi:hypothetical protein
MRTSMHSTIHKRSFDVITVYEFGRVRFGGQTWALGVAPLKSRGSRGWALTPRRGKKPGAIVISTHLPPDGHMAIEALIHETLHIAFPKAKEARIEAGARLLSKVLRKFEAAKQKGRRR